MAAQNSEGRELFTITLGLTKILIVSAAKSVANLFQLNAVDPHPRADCQERIPRLFDELAPFRTTGTQPHFLPVGSGTQHEVSCSRRTAPTAQSARRNDKIKTTYCRKWIVS